MLIYWLSIFYGFVVAKMAFCVSKRRSWTFFLWLPLIIFPLAMVAACRDLTIGTDLGGYGLRIFDRAIQAQSLEQPLSLFDDGMIEIGYIALNLLVAKFSISYHVFFFWHQFLVLSCVLLGTFLMREYLRKPEMFFLIYLLYLYAFSFSMLRQSLAVGISILAVYFLIQRNLKFFLLVCVLGYFFHNSILFFVPFYFLPDLIKRFPKVNFEILGGLCGAILYIVFPKIVLLLLSSGLINAKYERYANAVYNSHKTNLCLYVLLWLIALVYSKKERLLCTAKSEVLYNLRCVRTVCVLAFFIELCGRYNDIASRLTMYLFFWVISVLLHSIYEVRTSLSRVKIYGVAIVAFMILFFAYSGYVLRTADLFPYTSQILGIVK